MFEDDPLADEFDKYGTINKLPTNVHTRTQLALAAPSGNGESLFGYEEREARKVSQAAASYQLISRSYLEAV